MEELLTKKPKPKQINCNITKNSYMINSGKSCDKRLFNQFVSFFSLFVKIKLKGVM